MRIALVAPSGVPFAVGGAEKLWWGLLAHLNRYSPHAVELIKLPAPERDFWEVVESYRRFAALELDHFDRVISTKYPAWMVGHRDHVVYLQHTLRGLYDTYPEHLPRRWPAGLAALRPLERLLARQDTERDQLAELFGELERLRGTDLPGALLAFPGPLIRAVVRRLDAIALAPQAIRRYLAISATVARRVDYFPAGVPVEAVHHPSDLEGLHDGGDGGYFFTVSRLDAPKRLALLVEAYARVPGKLELRIAGAGPEREHLANLAARDPRVRLLGRLTDEEVVAQYARARAVLFVPRDEDMGLVTLEAMKAGKAVVTCTDSGGAVEFVRNGENGLVAEPDAGSLAQALTCLAQEPGLAARLGTAARATGEAVSWEATTGALLRDAGPGGRPRIVVASTFTVWPPDAGGKLRIYHLYRELARRADITLVCLAPPHTAPGEQVLAPGLVEVRVPPSARHQAEEARLTVALGLSVTDIAAIHHAHLSPALIRELKARGAGADLFIASHPYLYPVIRRVWTGPVWYDAHNVEVDLKAAMLPGSAAGREALDWVKEVEGACARDAERILAVSEADALGIVRRYGVSRDCITVVPNGTVLPPAPVLDPEERQARKAVLGVGNRLVAFFMGSWHEPNIEAARDVVAMARSCPGIEFWLAGGVCQHPDFAPPTRLPNNFRSLGRLTRRELSVVLAAVDVGLNPMKTGSGTNLKMLDYAASGVLILTSLVGARGLGFEKGVHCLQAEPVEVPAVLESIRARGTLKYTALIRAAHRLVKERYAWSAVIADVPLPEGAMRPR